MNRRQWLGAASGAALVAAAPSLQAQAQTQGARSFKLGLALGAGSARGFSHIGVLKALDQAGIKADIITGTSAGSLVGVFYAAGFTPWQLEEVALKVRDIDVADISSASKRGMFAGEALQKLVNGYVKQTPIEQLKIPFAAVATDLRSGDMMVLRSGDAGLAVRASCSIPGVFVPATVNGKELVDGGLTSPLPVQAARQMGADFVLAVDVGAKPQNAIHAGLYEVLLQSFEVMGRALTQAEALQADYVIRPDNARFASTDFAARKDLIQSGYEAAQLVIPQLKQRLLAGKPKSMKSARS
jgi:NTE family protein